MLSGTFKTWNNDITWSTKSKITKAENGENLEINEEVLVHWNIVKKDYQEDSRILYTCVLDKPFGQLLNISPKKIMFLKIFD